MTRKQLANTCQYLSIHLAEVSEKETSTIAIGGMSTFITKKFGLGGKIALLEGVEGEKEIDLKMCTQMYLVKAEGENKDRIYLMFDKEKLFLLPNQARTDTFDRPNWLYIVVKPQESNHSPVQDDPMVNEQEQIPQEHDVEDEEVES